MKKILLKGCLYVLALLVISTTGCLSLNKIEKGKGLLAFTGEYDSSKPLEEHSFLINLTDDYGSTIIMKGTRVMRTEIIILQPGTHNVRIDYLPANANDTRRPTVNIEYVFEAGGYYYVKGGLYTNKVEYTLYDLKYNMEAEAAAAARLTADDYSGTSAEVSSAKDTDKILATGTVISGKNKLHAASVIQGMDIAIDRLLKR